MTNYISLEPLPVFRKSLIKTGIMSWEKNNALHSCVCILYDCSIVLKYVMSNLSTGYTGLEKQMK